jgi:hypothetical protein
VPLCPVAVGTAWYLGTCPGAAAAQRITHAAAVTTVPPGLPGGVERVRRHGPDASYFFLLNDGTAAVIVTLPEPASAGRWRPGRPHPCGCPAEACRSFTQPFVMIAFLPDRGLNPQAGTPSPWRKP